MKTATRPTAASKAATVSSCPQCGNPGRKVTSTTIQSLLSPEALGRIDETNDLRFCKTETCSVVYFRTQSNEWLQETDLVVPVFQKSADPQRLVCYCFKHSVKAVREDAIRSRTSTIADDITDKCRRGLDRCEELNPQGACCLGNVRHVAKAALAEAGTAEKTQAVNTQEGPDCCCTNRESTQK